MNIALLEDDEISRIGLSALLKSKVKDGDAIYEFSQGHLLLNELDNYKIDLAFIDLDLEEELLGLEVLKKLSDKGIYCVVLTGHEEESLIVKGYELGAKDYLVKPIEAETVDAVLHRYQVEEKLLYGDNDGELAVLPREIIEKLRAYSFNQQPILITGESGTGKTFLAKNIHNFLMDLSVNDEGDFPFVALNCSELSESLIESELFGHIKGAFTGAESDKTGILERANGGVLFLDEIGSIPELVQRKLLKVLDEKVLYRVGDTIQRKVNFIIICATCEPLEDYIEQGKFRDDLFHRINGLRVNMPSFRNFTRFEKEEALKKMLKNTTRKIIFTDDAKDMIFNHYWSGNLRELNRFVEKCSSKGLGVVNQQQVYELLNDGIKEYVKSDLSSQDDLFSFLVERVEKEGLPKAIEDIESFMIHHFYKKCKGKSRKTIETLKISNNLFYKHIKKS